MCSRAGFFDDKKFLFDVNRHYQIQDFVQGLIPSYNIAPTQAIATLFNNYDYAYGHFGMIPSWAKDEHFKAVNARCETLESKPTFRDAIANKRCIVPLNGYYEWQTRDNKKIPYWISPRDGKYFAAAGIFDVWQDPNSTKIITGVSIITKTAQEDIAFIHDRMPVMLKESDWEMWLDKAYHKVDSTHEIFHRKEHINIHCHHVSSDVGDARNNHPDLIRNSSL